MSWQDIVNERVKVHQEHAVNGKPLPSVDRLTDDAVKSHILVNQIVPEKSVEPLTGPSGQSDTANGRRLVAKFGEIIRWVSVWDRWVVWDGQRWKIDNELCVESYSKEVAADLWNDIRTAVKSGNVDKGTVASMIGFARASNDANRIRNAVKMARSEEGIPVCVEDLDADHWLLNVSNGTVDLRTGEFREHRKEDFITKLAHVEFDPNAQCPTWDKFLERIFAGNLELIRYVQRLIGYSITGSQNEQILIFLYGDGANGKSTFIETILNLLGTDFAMKGAPELLIVKQGETHPTERADLFGKRFVACSETDDGKRLAEAMIKEMTGGDRIRSRFMRQDFFEFTPTHHIWLASNYKPVVSGTSHGIWRRVKLIPFDVTIPDAEQDKNLSATLELELPGILNWALKGCMDWRANGMREPEIVKAATANYKKDSDELGRFIEDECERGSEYTVQATRLFEAFVKATGSKMSQTAFGKSLGRMQFAKEKITTKVDAGKTRWRGLRLRADAGSEQVK